MKTKIIKKKFYVQFCSRVFPLEVSAISSLNPGVGYLLWSHGLTKHRMAELQLPHLFPFVNNGEVDKTVLTNTIKINT